MGVGVSVAKAQHPWTVVVRLWTLILLPNWVILCLHRKIRIQPSRVSIKWYPERGWSVRDFLFYHNFFPIVQKSWEKSRLVCASQNPLSLLVVLLSYGLLCFWLHRLCRIVGPRFSLLEFWVLVTFQSQLLVFIWIPCWSNPSTLGAHIRVWLHPWAPIRVHIVLESE
jgi:hypothetical protein